MPYAVSLFPTSSSPTPSFNPHARVRFGYGQPVDLNSRQLEAYQDAVLQSFPELKAKYGNPIDLKGGYRLLSFEMRRFINQTIQRVSPQKIIQYSQQHRFGIVEEGSDAMYELLQLRVVQNGWITKAQSTRWGHLLKEARAKNLPFADFMKQIESELPEHMIADFQKMSQLPYDQAKGLLGLMGGKYAIFSAEKGENFDMKAHTKPLLMDEIAELFEHQKGPSIDKMALSALGWLYTNVKLLPVRLFDRAILGYIHRKLNLPLHFQDLTQMSHYKILNRQYMHYYWEGGDKDFKKAYNARKVYYKGFEVIAEAGILNQAEREATRQKLEVLN